MYYLLALEGECNNREAGRNVKGKLGRSEKKQIKKELHKPGHGIVIEVADCSVSQIILRDVQTTTVPVHLQERMEGRRKTISYWSQLSHPALNLRHYNYTNWLFTSKVRCQDSVLHSTSNGLHI